MAFQEYELVILRRRPDGPKLEGEALENSGRAHREYLAGLREKGTIVSHGPVVDSPDAITGVMIYATGSIDETRRIAEADPAVAEGRLTPEVMRWRAWEGTLRLPGAPVA